MEFRTVGKTFQLVVDSGRDFQDILDLDEALWGATSAPSAIFDGDPVFLGLLDPAKTGRITSNEIKGAIRWLLDKIRRPEAIRADFDGRLPLSELKPETASALLDSAAYILGELGAEDREHITLKQIRDFFATVAKRPFNGDGVVSQLGANEIAAQYPLFKDVVADAIAATGGTPDADGTVGATAKNVTDFVAAAADYLSWLDAGALPAGASKSDILPMGADTAALAGLVRSADPLVTQYFKLSGLLGFDGRIEQSAMATKAKLEAFDPANQAEVDAYLASLPLSRPDARCRLAFALEGINPVHRSLWHQVVEKVLRPVLGEGVEELSPEQWSQVKALFAPYEAYMASKRGGMAEKIPVERLRQYVAMTDLAAMSQEAAARDKLVTDKLAAAREVERLLLSWTYLLRLVNNFVSFPELYDTTRRAMFECGSLVIDGRWFNLAFKVDNVAAHQAMAKSSLICIIYVEVDRGAAGKMNVVLPVTNGSKGNLEVGKRGVFFGFDGKEYDAKVVAIIVNPVCVREALLAPFIKMWGIVEGQIEGWSKKAETNMTKDFTKVVSDPSALAAKPAAAPAAKKDDKSGMLLGASVAVAALGSAFAFISNTLANMTAGAIWVTVFCALFALLAPISILAMIKLRKQDLSSLLEGCGWAINLRMKLNSKLRGQFTTFGKYPKDAKGTPKRRGLLVVLLTILVVLLLGWGVRWLQERQEAKERQAAEQAACAQPAPAASVAPSVSAK
ncbi:MAG: hypothetical protein ACI4WT_12850 [Oligosphaeraceae bacterium]